MRIEVLVIGGGATGSGIARDLSIRGKQVMLLERGDFCSGASGNNHGLLHSGARYVVNDEESARECAAENPTLKRIARSCVEDTGGLFVDLDGSDYLDKFLSASRRCGVRAEEMKVSEAFSLEPDLSRKTFAAVSVQDASVDPFKLVISNITSARENGAIAQNHSEIIEISKRGETISSVRYRDSRGKEKMVRPEMVVNASGSHSNSITSMAGIKCETAVDKGSMVVLNGRLVNRVINRLRPPSDGDIIVPNHTASILGTTSSLTGGRQVATKEEVEFLIRETGLLVPKVRRARAIRAYSGLRPLLPKGKGRSATRSFQIVDHSPDGIENMVSVIGGKLTTYRLMAEKASDLVMRKLGRKGRCRTHLIELPSAQEEFDDDLLCSCEQVSWGTVRNATLSSDVHSISELMRRTRAGMGFCQAGLCAFKLSSTLSEDGMENFLKERWKGIEPVLFGDQLKQEVFKSYLLKSYGIRYPPEEGG